MIKTMKSYKILFLSGLAVLAAGCKGSFFQNESPSAFTPNEIYSNVALTEQAVASIYEIFGEDRGYRNRLTCAYAGLNTDVEYNRKSNNEYATYQITPSNSDLSTAKGSDPWGYLNMIVERSNAVIDGISAYAYAEASHSDSLSFQYLQGEAYFLRAFALLEMVKYWGDIPVNVKAYDGSSLDDICQPKVGRNVAFEQIRKDLKHAAELMEWSETAQLGGARNDVRHPSRAAALALLARADLMYAGKSVHPTQVVAGCKTYVNDWNLPVPGDRYKLYQEVMWACNEVIKQEDYKLLDDYAQVFKNVCADMTNYAAMEQLWVIPFADGARGQVLNYNCAKFNSTADGDRTMDILLHNKKYNSDESEIKSNSSIAVVPTLLFEYDKADKRRSVTICPYKWNTATSGTIDPDLSRSEKSKYCLYQLLQADPSQWICGKYRIEWMSRDNDNQDDGIDFPVIRYADVLLMLAEASIGSLDNTPVTIDSTLHYTGQQAFDRVRARAGLTSTPLTLAAIQDERKYEFTGEYIRKWDLMRWGILKEKLIETRAALDELRTDYDGHNICATYKEDNSYLQPGAVRADGKPVVRAYVIDEVYGFKLNENDSKSSPWQKKSVKFSEKLASDSYVLYKYTDPETIESRQYWPIFSTIIGTSNGLLFNNYGY